MTDEAPKTLKSHGRLSISASLKPRDLMEEPFRVKGAWKAKIITLFPDAFPGVLGLSLTGKALDMGLWALETIDLRPFGIGKHLNVDDTPAGGGAGMVLRADGLTMLCGRFEGVDQRLLDHHHIEEVSLGDFVLTGGEIAATALIDATVRLLPKVLGNQASTEEESFSHGLLEHPQYPRPAVWNDLAIPDVLQSGHHGEIAKWRQTQAEEITKTRRPDLWQAYLRRKS